MALVGFTPHTHTRMHVGPGPYSSTVSHTSIPLLAVPRGTGSGELLLLALPTMTHRTLAQSREYSVCTLALMGHRTALLLHTGLSTRTGSSLRWSRHVCIGQLSHSPSPNCPYILHCPHHTATQPTTSKGGPACPTGDRSG